MNLNDKTVVELKARMQMILAQQPVVDRPQRTYTKRVKLWGDVPNGAAHIRGVPLGWWLRVAELSHTADNVAKVLIMLCDMKGTMKVHLRDKYMRVFGITPTMKSKAVRELREAGLISVEQRKGRHPIITVLAAWADQPEIVVH